MQWYGKTPACVKVKENEPLPAMKPESQTGVGVASLVDVWRNGSLFVQVTRVPIGIVKVPSPFGPWYASPRDRDGDIRRRRRRVADGDEAREHEREDECDPNPLPSHALTDGAHRRNPPTD